MTRPAGTAVAHARMPTALFFGLPLSGHTNPSLPLVAEITRRGTRVVYYSSPVFAGRIEAAGAEFRPYRNAFLNDLRQLPDRTDELSWLLTEATADILERQLAGVTAERADYVIADSVAPWGQWIGQLLDRPVVTSTTTFAINRHVMGYAVSHGVRPKGPRAILAKLGHIAKAVRLGRRLRRRYGVPGTTFMGMVFGQSKLNIVYTSRDVQPCAETFDDRFVFVGPALASRVEAAAFPWDELQHPTIVYVSLGTLFNRDVTFFRNCMQVLGGMDCQAVLSVGEQVRVEDLGQIPSNVLVRSQVPQLELLRRTSAFVTHAGMNSVNESLAFGVPMVVVPQMSEQYIVARRVEELGAGVYVDKSDAGVDTLRRAIDAVLGERRYRERAVALGMALREAGGVSRAVDAIEAFTGRAGTVALGS